METKTRPLLTSLAVSAALLVSCGGMDETVQQQEQAINDPCLCLPGGECPPPGCLPFGRLPLMPPPICGDGLLGETEECDGVNLGGETCASLGYSGGTLTCSSSCTFDASGCTTCGDGVIAGPEQCDGTALGGATCQDIGYDEGTVACTGTCQHNWDNCLDVHYAPNAFSLDVAYYDHVWGLSWALGPWCGVSSTGSWHNFCDDGDLCIDPDRSRCGHYYGQASGQPYTATVSGDGPWCGHMTGTSLQVHCEAGDACVDSSTRKCIRS